MVRATVDGTSAAAAFYAVVQIIAPSGRIMGSAITSSIAAGASADCTWFPRVGGGGTTVTPLPGQILSAYAGNATISDFTTNSTVFVDTGFPTNSTYNKVSSTSALLVVLLGDMTTGAAPDLLFLGVFIDGTNYATTGVHVSEAASFITAPATSHVGLGGSTSPPLAAGAHTVKVRTACVSGVNFTVRTSTSVALSIVEYEA